MKRVPCSLILLASVLIAPGAGRAADAENPVVAPSATSPQTSAPAARPRALSAQMAQRLAAVAPPYAPPASAKAAEPEVEDKPRNEIIRLPRYEVRERKLPPISEYQMLTPKGKLDLALKANPGLRFGSLWIFRNDGVAVEMLEEAAARERRRQMVDLLSLLPVKGGAAVTPAQQRLIEDALTPHSYLNMSSK